MLDSTIAVGDVLCPVGDIPRARVPVPDRHSVSEDERGLPHRSVDGHGSFGPEIGAVHLPAAPHRSAAGQQWRPLSAHSVRVGLQRSLHSGLFLRAGR